MKKIGMGLIGPGFVAAHHIDAVRRLGDVDVVAIAGSSQESADRKAYEYKVDRSYGDFRALIADPDVQVIHNTTPNHLHLPVFDGRASGRQARHLRQAVGPQSRGGASVARCRCCRQGGACCHLQLSWQSPGAAGTRHDRSRRHQESQLCARPLSARLDDRLRRLLLEVRSVQRRCQFRARRYRFPTGAISPSMSPA